MTSNLAAAPIPRLAPRANWPLSPAQRGAWMREQIHPDNLFYNVFRTLRLSGPLDADRLRAALQAIVDRHDVLRATFAVRDGEPVQSFAPLTLAVALEDLSALDPAAAASEIARRVGAVARAPFDLASGPLLRARLLRAGTDEHLLVVALHHIVVDGVSILRAVTEILATYHGRPVAPPEIQYQDFAVWQQGRLESGALEPLATYWLERLGGTPPLLELPADRPRPATPSYEGASRVVHLRPDLVQALKALREARSTTLFRTLLAAFKVLMHRLTGETDIVVGSPLSGRTHPQIKEMIGFFVNTPALRTDLSGDPTFLEALARVHETASGAIEHQDFPFAEVIERLNPNRDLSRLPLYSVVFTQEPLAPSRRIGDLLVSQGESVLDVAPFDLTVAETEMDGGVRLVFKYSRDLFDGRTIERLAACFERLLESIAATPEAPVGDLEILPAAERARLLVDFNRTAAPAPAEIAARSFPAVFAWRVATHPEAVAAVCGEQRVSYADLGARAARVARWLRRRGARREVRVGVFGERGIGMLATIAGILEAAAAWVPLEPAHPDVRLAAMLRDSGLRFLATERRLVARSLALTAGPTPPPQILCWDAPLDGDEAEPARLAGLPTAATTEDDAAAEPASGKELACVFFTSGSTGTPKGAMVARAGMTNHLWAKVALLGLGPASVVAQNASHGFDISVWQMLAPLLAGGRVLLIDDDTAADPAGLLACLERHGATVLETVPTLLAELLAAAGETTSLLALTFLISNAETLPVALCRRWFERFPAVPLVNTYGATECSDDTTHQVFVAPPPAAAARVSVGRPIPGLRLYVVDRRLRPVPEGCPGQIAMAGVGVGRGYLGSPDKTAAAFLPDPFGPPGERLYLSGDLGRWTAAGEIDLLGRLDNQLKVRGHRVELGEVEAALARHPTVRQAAVVARPDGRGGNRLLAYLVADSAPAAADLHAFLAQTLPRPMLPERFVQLAALPLNRNGKVDRAALPEPAGGDAPLPDGYTAPRNHLETVVAGLWQSVLGIDRVGVHDDFFALGGHSLRAIQLAARMKTHLGGEMTVRDLFLTPTVAGLAAAAADRGVAATPRVASDPTPPVIARLPDRPHYPLSIAQTVQWFAAQMTDRGSRGEQKPAEIVTLEGPVDRPALRAAIRLLIDRHEALRTAFFEAAGEPVQAIRAAVEPGCPEVDLSHLDAARRQDQIGRLLDEAARPFDLAAPPLLRVRLLRLDGERHLLLLNAPHIVSDGWSEQLLLRDLAASYNAFRARLAPPAAPQRRRLVDAAAWQRAQMQTPSYTAQRDFWLAKFRASAPALTLPLRLPGQPPEPRAAATSWALTTAPVLTTAPEAAAATLVLAPDLALRVARLAAARGATHFMVLMTAFKALLARWTGQTDLVVGSVLACRSHPDLESLVGVFINTLALRSDHSGNPDFATMLERVRRTTLEAIAHQDYPFHSWLEILRRERRDSAYLPFSALFVLHQKPALATFDGLTAGYLLHHEITGEAPAAGGMVPGGAGEPLLRLDAIESRGTLQVMLSAGSGGPGAAALAWLLRGLRAILDQVARRPEALLAELRLAEGAGGAEGDETESASDDEPRQVFATVHLADGDLEELFGEAAGTRS